MPDPSPHTPFLPPKLTLHARLRMEQRGVTPDQIALALVYGTKEDRGGVRAIEVGEDAVERAMRCSVDIRGAEGLRLICDRTGKVITLYRRGRGPSHV